MAKTTVNSDLPVTSADLALNAERVVEEAPDLPKVTVSSEAELPTIDTALIALRNAQAAAEAKRFGG
jgi:hypothetical protein